MQARARTAEERARTRDLRLAHTGVLARAPTLGHEGNGHGRTTSEPCLRASYRRAVADTVIMLILLGVCRLDCLCPQNPLCVYPADMMNNCMTPDVNIYMNE